MRPTLTYVKEKFEYYNKLCFDGSLTMPPIRLNLRKRSLGMTNLSDRHIEISVHDDLPEEEYIDTIVHEMIHYYILCNGIKDNAPHGTEFYRIMNRIKKNHGIKVTISYEPSEEELCKKVDRRTRNVIVVEYWNGDVALAVVAKNKLSAITDAIDDNDDEIERWTHYVSDRAIFGYFPVQIIPRFTRIDENKLTMYLNGAHMMPNNT